MASTKHLTAAQRARRKKIKALILDARVIANECYRHGRRETAQLLDDLADVAEKYLEGLK